MLNSDNPVLRAKALVDLTKRARNGIPLYLAIWLVMAIWADFPSRTPVAFYTNLGLLVAIALVRTWHYRRVTGGRAQNLDRYAHLLVALLLLSGLHWGLLSAWFIYHPDFSDVSNIFTIILAAFAMGGTPILGISRVVRTWYPACIFAPSLVATLYVGQHDSTVLALFIVFAMIYIYSTSRIVGADYHDASNNHWLAEERAARLEEQRTLDGLTGIRNRGYFDERFTQDWALCRRLGQPLSVLMIDLDHFKQLNDTYGHLCGDECLKAVAAALRAQLHRTTDTVARYGGEEFVALLPGTTAQGATRIAAEIIERVADLQPVCSDRSLVITCSIGVATVTPQPDDTPAQLLEHADQALYRAKSDGRNRLEVARAA